MNTLTTGLHLTTPPTTDSHTWESSDGPRAWLSIDDVDIYSDSVDHFLAIADAAQNTARLLRLAQLRHATSAVA